MIMQPGSQTVCLMVFKGYISITTFRNGQTDSEITEIITDAKL